MKYINKKQKIILITIISIVTLAIAYYTYISKANEEFNVENQNLEIDENEDTNNNENSVENENKKEAENPEKIIVHVSGAVKNEGIVELEEKTRIADAIEKAGGVTENAYMKDINLATKLEDGMKIYIPTKEEAELEKKNGSYTYNSGINSDANNSEKNNTSGKNISSKVNINTATKEELDTLPGIGESTATKIMNYREENGKFKTIEEIKEVSGIGDSKYEQIKDLIEI